MYNSCPWPFSFSWSTSDATERTCRTANS